MLELIIVQVLLLVITIIGMIVTIKMTRSTKIHHRNIARLLHTAQYGQLQGIVGSIDEMIETLEYRFRAMRNYWESCTLDKSKALGSTEPTEEELISTEAMRYQPLMKVADTLRRASKISKWLKDEYPDTYKQLEAALDRVKK